jgi:hypothetical protein
MMPHSDTIVIRAQLAAGASTFRAKSMELLRAIVERARVKMTQFARRDEEDHAQVTCTKTCVRDGNICQQTGSFNDSFLL